MVAFYIRISRPDDDLDEHKQLSNSIENQRKLLTEFFEESPELRLEDFDEFIDDGFSGTNFERPAFRKMLHLIKKRTVDTVIVKDFSRFGRNYVECADYLEKLFPFLGTRFISVLDNYDSGRQDDVGIDLAMRNIVNSYYSQDLSKKVTTTFDLRRENGEFFFRTPFGYLEDEKRPGKVIIDEEAAVVVRKIFSLACEENRTTCEIAKLLNRERVPTVAAYNRSHMVRGKPHSQEKSEFAAWTGTKVAQILKNEVYTGTYICRKTRRVVAGSKKVIPIKSPKKIPDNHPAIVGVETFEAAQKIFRRTKKPAENRRYQLKSKVFCGNCGYAMTYQENVHDECFFRCPHARETGLSSGCPDDRFPEELLNGRVYLRLRQWMTFLLTACGKAEEEEKSRWECLELLEEESAELTEALESLGLEKIALYESYTAGEISREELATGKQKLSQESDSINAELTALQERESALRTLRNRHKPELDALLESVHLFQNEPRLTRRMSETFISHITIQNKWQIDIEWKDEKVVREVLDR
ncbi:MAG: recombinase family protein [Oscillospiraceae bacterium]|nr:recombinase family protein [Oscillospiraceae bacterium]